MDQCPICKKASDINQSSNSDRDEINCKRCGKYTLSNTLKTTLDSERTVYPKLSGVLRETHENGGKEYLDTNTYMKLEEKGRSTRLTDRIKKFLGYLANKTNKFGEEINIDTERDWALAYCCDKSEFNSFLTELKEQGLIYFNTLSGNITSDAYGKSLIRPINLTYKSWIRLFESSEGVNSNKVFLAYDFKNEEVDKAILKVKECLTEIGLEPVDLKTSYPDHNQKISDKIIAEIRSAKFIIADCTTYKTTPTCIVHNPNVYFEAGFSMGLDRNVIFICDEKCLKDLPFDTNHYSHIGWDISRPDDFKQKLKDRMTAKKII